MNSGLLPEFNGKKYPMGFPETVAIHAHNCPVCKKNNCEPFCDEGGRMLSTWIMGLLQRLWDETGEEDSFSE